MLSEGFSRYVQKILKLKHALSYEDSLMAFEKVNYKRVGPPKALSKDDSGYVWVRLSLNEPPNWTWIECFKNPSNLIPNAVHPKQAQVDSNFIDFQSSENGIKQNVESMDKYIQQANDVYNNRMAEQIASQERKEEGDRAGEEDLDKLNESLNGL